MGWLRGNPRALLITFFSLAVFFTGSLYSIAGRVQFGNDPLDTLTTLALGISLLFVLLILMRILWVTTKLSDIPRPTVPESDMEDPHCDVARLHGSVFALTES